MRAGTFPGQQEALRQRFEEERTRGRRLATRRTFLGLSLGGVAGAAAGGGTAAAILRHPASAEGDAGPRDPAVEWARSLARGPLDELLNTPSSFLATIERLGGDPIRWIGVERLGLAALSGVAPDARALRRRVLTTLHSTPPPDHLSWLTRELQRRR